MNHSPFQYLGSQLQLREFAVDDAPDIQRLHADPRVRALLPDTHPLQQAEWARDFAVCLEDFYRRHPGLGIWRCALRVPGLPPAAGEYGLFAGWFSLMPMHRSRESRALGVGGRDVELGSRLMPEHWGGGLALRGGEVLLNHAFTTLGLETVWGVCHPDNRNARACLQALGFSRRGMAPYEGQDSEHHALEAGTWARVRSFRVRQRLRHLRELSQQRPGSVRNGVASRGDCGQP